MGVKRQVFWVANTSLPNSVGIPGQVRGGNLLFDLRGLRGIRGRRGLTGISRLIARKAVFRPTSTRSGARGFSPKTTTFGEAGRHQLPQERL